MQKHFCFALFGTTGHFLDLGTSQQHQDPDSNAAWGGHSLSSSESLQYQHLTFSWTFFYSAPQGLLQT